MALWNEWAEKNGEWIVDLGASLGSGKHVEPVDFLEMSGMESSRP